MSAVYTYGIVRKGALKEAPRMHGVDPSRPPRLLDAGDLTAVVGDVDVGEFEGAALERNVADPRWLEDKVRAHERVLDDVLAAATVVPMRFGSIFSDASGLESMLAAHAGALLSALDRVEGRTEWGVKVHCDLSALEDGLVAAAPVEPSGRGYLMQRKARLEAGARAAEAAAEAATVAHDALADLADEAVTAPGRSAAPGLVLNGAYLVPDDRRDDFMRRVSDLQARHGESFFFDVTGPWPPYHFVAADVAGPR